MIRIRPFEPDDRESVVSCIAALQEFGRAQDPRLPPGRSMAEPYMTELLADCARHEGALLVAQCSDLGVVGFAAVLAQAPAAQPWDGVEQEARLVDLYVRPAARQSGVGGLLIEQAITFA